MVKRSAMSIKITNIELTEDMALTLTRMSQRNGKLDIIKKNYLQYNVSYEDNYRQLIEILDLVEECLISNDEVEEVGCIFDEGRMFGNMEGNIYTYKGNIYVVYHTSDTILENDINMYYIMTPGHHELMYRPEVEVKSKALLKGLLDLYWDAIRKKELVIIDEFVLPEKLELLYDLEDPEVHRGFYKISNKDAYFIMTFGKKTWKVLDHIYEIPEKEIVRNKEEMLEFINSDDWKHLAHDGDNIDFKDSDCEDVIAKYNFMYRCEYLLKYSDKKYKYIMDMFDGNDDEHPTDTTIMSGLQIGDVWSYISSDYLNGLINYTGAFHSIMIRYYTPLAENSFDSRNTTWEQACASVVTKFDGHTNLSEACDYDDILILGETLDSYWLLWRSCGGSSSIIGRLGKYQVKDRQELIEILHNSVSDLSQGHKEYLVLPSFVGWITL